MLPKCFTPSELEYLNQQPEFLAAVAAMQTIEDFENTVRLGNEILDGANEFDMMVFLRERFTVEEIIFLLRQKEFTDALEKATPETERDLANLARRLLEMKPPT